MMLSFSKYQMYLRAMDVEVISYPLYRRGQVTSYWGIKDITSVACSVHLNLNF